jgi:signal transduction histidine kinase
VTTTSIRDRVTGVLVVASLLAGVAASVFGSYDSGITWRTENGRLIVYEVEPKTQAARDGVAVGMIATSYNDNELLNLPHYEYGDAPPDSQTGEQPIIGVSPAVPTPQITDDAMLLALVRQPIESINLISPDGLAQGTPDMWPIQGFYYPGSRTFFWAPFGMIGGLVILCAGVLWLRSGRASPALRELALPLALAVASPLLLGPLAAIGSFWPVLLALLLRILTMIPLALGLTDRIERPDDRRLVLIGIVGLITGAAMAAVGQALDPDESTNLLAWAFTAAIPLVPGVVAAGPIDLKTLRGPTGRGAGGLLQSTELALAGTTPLFAMQIDTPPYPWWLILWLLAIFVAARFTVRPLARLATRATLQRDLVVAATEAERARLAADIHDDALQELTLLVRRLEASGDAEGAEIGRTVADRLRAICGDLRLPILDDLGVGPALDWLVLRIERLAGGEVRLERADDTRHSPDVELAIFRVAQEALANAVKHGKPPIIVRYRSTPAGISLAIDDAGPGIAEDAPESAEKAGRFGLLNMAQRAEQIGAILDVKRWPSGGTHVALEWRPR